MKNSFFAIEHPASYRRVAGFHLPYVVITAPFLLAARFMPSDLNIIPACLFQRLTGMPCMFCGYTRAFQAIARLRFAHALRDNPAALILFAIMLAVLTWNLAGLISKRIIRRGTLLRTGNPKLVGWGLLAIFLLNWMYRLAMSGTCHSCH